MVKKVQEQHVFSDFFDLLVSVTFKVDFLDCDVLVIVRAVENFCSPDDAEIAASKGAF